MAQVPVSGERASPVRLRRRRAAGFTIMEMMIVVAIVGLMLGAASLAFHNVIRSELRSAASHTAAALKHGFDKATMTGMTVRVVFDMEAHAVWLEGTAERVTISKEGAKAAAEWRPEQGEGGRPRPAPPLPLIGGVLGGAEGEEQGGGTAEDVKQLLAEVARDQKPVERAAARFVPIKGLLTKRFKLPGTVRVDAVITPRMVEPVSEGQGHVYFFPQGHGEPAIIHLANDDDEFYSVVLHPLTGQARVYPCRYRIPTDFGVSDDKRSRQRGEQCEDEPQ